MWSPVWLQPVAAKLFSLFNAGQLQCLIDTGSQWQGGPFYGLESIYDAIDYLYTKRSVGKVIVELPDPVSSKL